ncbi:hypothetical protein GCM10023231_40800 [Olivibacter ginsenosidimutans]|uniref:Carbohydrate-binding domain-containing protein n=1 Tax=Olivibacter ginsenosidimutans TaxID=1176537 RepID=A0ABP9CAD8_9SPHI
MDRYFFKFGQPILTALLIGLITFGCTKNDPDETINDNSAAPSGGTVAVDETAYTSGTPEGSTETGADDEDLVENATFDKMVSINFGTEITVSNPYANQGVTVTLTDENVVINSSLSEVDYVLSGTTTKGSVKIYSDKKFKLTLNAVSISSTNGPALNIQSKKRAFVVLADGTDNHLTDAATYTSVANEDMKGTLFSEGQLIFSGNGALTIVGNYSHGICSDDYIRIRSGNITVGSAIKDGIHANDAFIGDGGTVTIKADSDGIEAEEGFIIINKGDFTLNVGDDGIVASYEEDDTSIDPFVVINGGDITVNTTEGEGIESKSHLTINDGNIVTNTADDGLNAKTAIYINGGQVYSISTGNDAMDSNGTFTVTGGIVIAVGSKQPEAGFDCDARTFKITGGLVLGTGGATSSPTANVCTVYSVVTGGIATADFVHIEDEAGNEVLTFKSPTSFNTMLFASTKLKVDTKYYVYTGGSIADGTAIHGVYTTGNYTRGTAQANFTTSNRVTQIGGSISRN